MTQIAETADAWHVELDGTRHGPVTESEVEKLIMDRKLDRDSLCWRPGEMNWQPLISTPLAKHFLNEPPPLKPTAVPNGWVWTLAFAPIIGAFLEELVFELTANPLQKYMNSAGGHLAQKFWWVTVLLNIALSLVDAHRLKKAGYDTAKMGMAWIVPVYLYKRATTLKQNLAYFFVWIASFGLTFFL